MAMDRTTRSSHLRTRSSFTTRKGFTSYKSLAGLRRKPSLSRSRKDGERINGFQARTRSGRSIDQNRSTSHGEHRIDGDKGRKAINPSQTEEVRSSGRNVSNVTRCASKPSTIVSKKEVSTIVTKEPVSTIVTKEPVSTNVSKSKTLKSTVKIEALNDEQKRPIESSQQSVVSILKNSPTSDQKLRSKKCVRICVPIKEERLSVHSNDQEESLASKGVSKDVSKDISKDISKDTSKGVSKDISKDTSTEDNSSRQDGGSINTTIVSNPVRDRRKTRALSNLGLVRVVSKVTNSCSSSSASVSSMASRTNLDGIKEEESIKSEVTFGPSSTSSNCSKNGGHRGSRKVASDRVYKIQKIIKSQRRSNGLRYFFVKWKNWPSQFNSWEPETNFSPDLLQSLGYKPTVKVNGIKNSIKNSMSGLDGKNGLKVATATDMASVQFDLLSKVKNSSIDTISTNRKIDLRTSSPKTNGQKLPIRITDPLKNETMNGKNGFCSNVPKVTCSNVPKATCSNIPKSTIPKASVSKMVSEAPNSESLENLVPKKILTIEPTRQGLVVLMKWTNYPLLSWLDYEWVKAKYPDLCFEYHESMIRFRSRPIVDIDNDDD